MSTPTVSIMKIDHVRGDKSVTYDDTRIIATTRASSYTPLGHMYVRMSSRRIHTCCLRPSFRGVQMRTLAARDNKIAHVYGKRLNTANGICTTRLVGAGRSAVRLMTRAYDDDDDDENAIHYRFLRKI